MEKTQQYKYSMCKVLFCLCDILRSIGALARRPLSPEFPPTNEGSVLQQGIKSLVVLLSITMVSAPTPPSQQ